VYRKWWDLLAAAGDKQQPLALSDERTCGIRPPQGMIETSPRILQQLLSLCQLCVSETPSVLNDCDVALSLMLGEPFHYFPNIICYIFILNIFIKSLNFAVSSDCIYNF
jgi:hypothetical protein